MLEAKDQGHKRKCSQKKGSLKNLFRRSPKKKRLQKFFWAFSKKNVFEKKFQAIYKILMRSFAAKDFKMCPQGRHRGLHLC